MANEYLRKLSGTKEEKIELFEILTNKLLAGEQLTDAERSMYEFLRNELTGGDVGI